MGSRYQETAWSQSWSQSVLDSFVRDTGRTVEEWVAIAKSCPETTQRKQLAWFKSEHGLLQNRALHVLSLAFGHMVAMQDQNPEALVDALFAKYPDQRPHYEAILDEVLTWEGVIASARKTYVALNTPKQFAVLFPKKAGLHIGLALPQETQRPSYLRYSEKPVGGGDRLKHLVILGMDGLTRLEEIYPWLKQARDYSL